MSRRRIAIEVEELAIERGSAPSGGELASAIERRLEARLAGGALGADASPAAFERAIAAAASAALARQRPLHPGGGGR